MSASPASGRSVGEALRDGAALLRDAGVDAPELDARVLLLHARGWSHEQLIAEAKAPMPAAAHDAYEAMLARRAAREPVAYIVGVKEFWGLSLRVAPGVLIPRADTETLVAEALEIFAGRPPARILDLGSGSGALLLALLTEFPAARGFAVDASSVAARMTLENAGRLGLADRAHVWRGNWGSALDAGARFDLVVSNPPYIPEPERASLPQDVARYEPAGALFAGPDGMACYREIFAAAGRLVAEGGALIIEIAADGAARTQTLAAEMLRDAWPGLRVAADLAGRPRALAFVRGR